MLANITHAHLSQVLQTLNLTGVFYCQSMLGGDWGISFEPMPNTMMFHLVTEGECLVECGRTPVKLSAGDFVVLPRGNGHSIKSKSTSPVKDIFSYHRDQKSSSYETLTVGGRKPITNLLCGFARLEHPVASLLADSLPTIISISTGRARLSTWMNSFAQLIRDELQEPNIGHDTIVSRMADILIIQAIRLAVGESDSDKGWLGALRDPVVGKALELIHSHPTAPLTLESLARQVGVSRSTLSQKFSDFLGVSPMKYRINWRMSLVHREYSSGNATVAELCDRFGYSSESSFRKAFKESTGRESR